MPSLFDLSRRFPAALRGKKPTGGGTSAGSVYDPTVGAIGDPYTGLGYDPTKYAAQGAAYVPGGYDPTQGGGKSLGMPGGTPGASMMPMAGAQNMNAGSSYGTGGGDPYARPTNTNGDPSLGSGVAPAVTANGGAGRGRAPYVPGSNPLTANQGYTAQDFWNGKAGFAGLNSGAEKQEWLQNNMTPITGHNYLVDTTAHNAAVQAKLGANNAAAMQGFKDNPMYGALTSGTPGTGDASGPQGNYYQRNGFADRGAAQAAATANWQNPDWVMQQIMAGKISPQAGNPAQFQQWLDSLPPDQRQAYMDKYKSMWGSGSIAGGIFGNG